METEIESVSDSAASRQRLVEDLSVQINSRTSTRITPQLQAYSDATSKLARAESRIEELEKTLRQWDRADDLESKAAGFLDHLTKLRARLLDAQSVLDARKTEILDEIDDEFGVTVAAIGIPSVETAAINRKNYLPILNGKAFDKFSPVGGLRTVTQVAYWVSLLTVAVRRRDTQYPAFLLIDSPRTSLNDSDDLSSALYRRLVTMADAAGDRVQMIIGDNELAAHYRRDYAQLDFNYDHPTIYTIHHPGREAVDLLTTESDSTD